MGRLFRRHPRPGRDGSAGGQPARGGTGCHDCLLLDDLTQLGARLSIKDRLDRAMADTPGGEPCPALLVIDIDRFKSVNETFGTSAGDEVLRATARRLVSVVTPGGSAFRTGGDEFMVVLDDTTADAAVSTAQRVLCATGDPVATEGGSIGVSASVAVVMLGERHRPDAVLRHADLTMYRAKVMGGGRVDMYSSSLDDWAHARRHDLDSLASEVEELRLENQRLSEAVMIDAQTGLPNGMAFDADHLQLHARRSRSGERYALLLADIDHFHDYNERFRRSGGQRVLRAVAQTIRGNVRQGDRAYCYGDAQFAVLLPGAASGKRWWRPNGSGRGSSSLPSSILATRGGSSPSRSVYSKRAFVTRAPRRS